MSMPSLRVWCETETSAAAVVAVAVVAAALAAAAFGEELEGTLSSLWLVLFGWRW